MREMATHIGAYEVLLICERFGGQDIYVPADTSKSPFVAVIGHAKAQTLSWVYRREKLAIPTARYALARARRADTLAAVRAGEMTVADMARTLGIRRDYASKLVTQTDEGLGVTPIRPCRATHDPRQIDMFDEGTGA